MGWAGVILKDNIFLDAVLMLCESSVTVELAIYHGQCPCFSHTAVMKCGDRATTGAYSLLLKPAVYFIQTTNLYIYVFIELHVL